LAKHEREKEREREKGRGRGRKGEGEGEYDHSRCAQQGPSRTPYSVVLFYHESLVPFSKELVCFASSLGRE
jgi:hypothetical protein